MKKLKNKITDMHDKAITKLLKYDIIYIPKLNTKQITKVSIDEANTIKLYIIKTKSPFAKRRRLL